MDNYWIRANPNAGLKGFDGGINSAILRYEGAPVSEPTTQQGSLSNSLNEVDLHPLIPTPVVCILLSYHLISLLNHTKQPGKPWPGGVDVVHNLEFGFVCVYFKFGTV